MLLIHPQNKKKGRWTVAWMWLPTFLSMNSGLVKYVDEKLTEEFKNKDLSDPSLQHQMHEAVIRHITTKNTIPGLADYLRGISAVAAPEDMGQPAA